MNSDPNIEIPLEERFLSRQQLSGDSDAEFKIFLEKNRRVCLPNRSSWCTTFSQINKLMQSPRFPRMSSTNSTKSSSASYLLGAPDTMISPYFLETL